MMQSLWAAMLLFSWSDQYLCGAAEKDLLSHLSAFLLNLGAELHLNLNVKNSV
jgi:hypothetical protein